MHVPKVGFCPYQATSRTLGQCDRSCPRHMHMRCCKRTVPAGMPVIDHEFSSRNVQNAVLVVSRADPKWSLLRIIWIMNDSI